MMLTMRAAHALPSHNITVTVIRKILLATLLAVCPLAAQAPKPAPHPKPNPRMTAAIDKTLELGADAVLPPHVSNLLGISPQELETPVKQNFQPGEPIRGFEVSKEEHKNVVLFVESRANKESTFYLTSPTGILRKVLSVREGVGYARTPTKEDKETFEKEKQYWLDRIVPKKQ
jgi:hypothetical protein